MNSYFITRQNNFTKFKVILYNLESLFKIWSHYTKLLQLMVNFIFFIYLCMYNIYHTYFKS